MNISLVVLSIGLGLALSVSVRQALRRHRGDREDLAGGLDRKLRELKGRGPYAK